MTIKTVEKLWGRELWHHNDLLYCMKTLVIEPRACSSLHYHRVKYETFLVAEGTVWLELGGSTRLMLTGSSVDIQPGYAYRHRFRAASEDGKAVVIEASTYHDDDDTVRIEEAKLL